MAKTKSINSEKLFVVALLLVLGLPVQAQSASDPIVGTWSLTAYVSGASRVAASQTNSTGSMTFLADGTFSFSARFPYLQNPVQSFSGTWSRNNDGYTLSVGTQSIDLGLNGNLLEQRDSSTSEVTATWTKQ